MNAPAPITRKRHYVDTQDVPGWGTSSRGDRVRLDMDSLLTSEFDAWQASECGHDERKIVKSLDSIGRPQFHERCCGCGLKLTSAIAHASVRGCRGSTDPEKFDRLSVEYEERRARELDELARRAADRKDGTEQTEYQAYLLTPKWRKMRDLVLSRASYRCEGCLVADAQQVHHLTYAHKYDEFAFELVALCDQCHRRVHGGG